MLHKNFNSLKVIILYFLVWRVSSLLHSVAFYGEAAIADSPKDTAVEGSDTYTGLSME